MVGHRYQGPVSQWCTGLPLLLRPQKTRYDDEKAPRRAALAAQRDAFFAEVNKDAAAIAAVEEDMFKSIVERSVEKGLIVASDSGDKAGRLLIQPELVVDGSRKLLDDGIGAGFSIIGYDCDPAEALSEQDMAPWIEMGASVVRVVSEQSARGAGSLLDEGQELARWLGKKEPVIMLVRPDRFCMACAQPGEASAVLERARGVLAGARWNETLSSVCSAL